MGTDFNIIYTRFYSKITDDMYMELDSAQTDALLEELLINALPWFEFPRISLQYSTAKHCFRYELSDEEVNIIATYMVLGWFDQQLASVEVSRMKFSGSDFRFTSQANHMAKLKNLRTEYERIGFHLQRLYKRRKIDSTGRARSTFGSIMASSVRSGTVTYPAYEDKPVTPPDESWEDMGDAPSDRPNDNPPSSDGWNEMEDLPTIPTPDDGWDSV
jgi:hypothetical protein